MAKEPICIIPARGGSKRIPRKNLLVYKGKPLVEWAVKRAAEAEIFKAIYLSSDSHEILNSVGHYRELIKLERDPILAEDNVRADDVVRDLVNQLKISSDNVLCCLLPTTPLLSSSDLSDAFKIMKTSMATVDVVFGITKSRETPFRTFTLSNEQMLSALFPEKLLEQSNEYPETYTDAGHFYFAKARTWKKYYSITAARVSKGYILDNSKCIDINSIQDWERFLRENPEN